MQRTFLKTALAALLGLGAAAIGHAQSNALPSVSLANPVNNLVVTASPGGSQIKLLANAADSDGTISKVEFYRNNSLYATVSGSLYQTGDGISTAGTFSYFAKAYDNLGAVATSATASVTVIPLPSDRRVIASENQSFTVAANQIVRYGSGNTWLEKTFTVSGSVPCTNTTFATDPLPGVNKLCTVANSAPTVSMDQSVWPAGNTIATAPASVTLKANVSDDGVVAKVEYYSGALLIGTSTAAPFSVNWANVPAGNYTLSAKAYDDRGLVTASAPVSLNVGGPYIVGGTYNTPDPVGPGRITIDFNAAGMGTVTKVEYYNGSSLLGSTAAEPHSFAWNNVPVGTYTLSMKAFNSLGGSAVSWHPEQLTIKTNTAPTVALSAPSNGATYTAPATVAITANAADSDGSVTKVEFYRRLGDGSTALVGTSTAAPYSVNWANVPAGTFGVLAKAYDNKGAVTTSAVSSVTVSAATNKAPTISLMGPASGATYTAPASVAITASAADSDGSVAKVEFYNGATLLGTVTTGTGDATLPAGTAKYTYTWANVAAGTYSITAKAYDDKGAVTATSAASITVSAATNKAPTVDLTAPLNGATFTAPANVSVTAMAADSDGTISKVEFYNGTTLVGTATGSALVWDPVATKYQATVTLSNLAAGTYSVTAKAYDDKGAITTSTASSITVSAAANKAPTVSLTAPAGGATYTAPASVTITATAADTDGTIAKVEYYNGTTLLGTSTTAPYSYSYSWTNVAAGSYSITAKAYDNQGATTTSTAAAITVSAAPVNKAPTVSLTAPAGGATYTAPASVSITATAADTDGTIAKVEFYNGSTLLGTSTTAPYSYSWTSVAAGSYSITAKAYDNGGATTSSSAASITVMAAPVAATTLYFVHPDHLGTPRLIADQNKKTVWRWDNLEPFGQTGLQEDPDADTKKFTFNLRFAGQYYDAESGLHYNRNRDYDPATGRYVQADPIGLKGGISLYGYVSGNPLSFIDPLGLAKCPDVDRGPNGEPLRARATIDTNDLGTGTGTNASSRAYAQSMGNASDDAGHILGRNLGGSGGKDNIFAQASNINRGSFAKFEGKVADFIRSNGSVDVEVTFKYAQGGTRPTKVLYDVFQNGQKVLSQGFAN